MQAQAYNIKNKSIDYYTACVITCWNRYQLMRHQFMAYQLIYLRLCEAYSCAGTESPIGRYTNERRLTALLNLISYFFFGEKTKTKKPLEFFS
mgnify:CR=1 FL=1